MGVKVLTECTIDVRSLQFGDWKKIMSSKWFIHEMSWAEIKCRVGCKPCSLSQIYYCLLLLWLLDFQFCLSVLFAYFSGHNFRLGWLSQSPVEESLCRLLQQDNFPVYQPTVSRHWRSDLLHKAESLVSALFVCYVRPHCLIYNYQM